MSRGTKRRNPRPRRSAINRARREGRQAAKAGNVLPGGYYEGLGH